MDEKSLPKYSGTVLYGISTKNLGKLSSLKAHLEVYLCRRTNMREVTSSDADVMLWLTHRVLEVILRSISKLIRVNDHHHQYRSNSAPPSGFKPRHPCSSSVPQQNFFPIALCRYRYRSTWRRIGVLVTYLLRHGVQ